MAILSARSRRAIVELAVLGLFKRDHNIERLLPTEWIRVARAAYFVLCEYFDA